MCCVCVGYGLAMPGLRHSLSFATSPIRCGRTPVAGARTSGLLRHRLGGLAGGGGAITWGSARNWAGLLAGVSLASTPFREAIAARLASLRDFLLLFFFIALGASLDLSVAGGRGIGPANPSCRSFVLIRQIRLIVLIIMTAMGYRKRTGVPSPG